MTSIAVWLKTADLLDRLPQTIADERARRGLTLRAAAAQVGVSGMCWSKWETESTEPTLGNTSALLRWLAGAS